MALQRWEYRWEYVGLTHKALAMVMDPAMTAAFEQLWPGAKAPVQMGALNSLGAEGWEAVSVSTSDPIGGFGVLLKRPVDPGSF